MTYFVADHRQDTWSATNRRLNEVSAEQRDDAYWADRARNTELSRDIRQLQGASVGLLIGAAVLEGAAIGMWLTAPAQGPRTMGLAASGTWSRRSAGALWNGRQRRVSHGHRSSRRPRRARSLRRLLRHGGQTDWRSASGGACNPATQRPTNRNKRRRTSLQSARVARANLWGVLKSGLECANWDDALENSATNTEGATNECGEMAV